jgi:hypothetical protein
MVGGDGTKEGPLEQRCYLDPGKGSTHQIVPITELLPFTNLGSRDKLAHTIPLVLLSPPQELEREGDISLIARDYPKILAGST